MRRACLPVRRQVLCQSGLAVAFVSLDGITHWLATTRSTRMRAPYATKEPRTAHMFSVAYFSPDDEIEPFESQVIAPLVVALAPSQSSDDDDDASQAPSSAGAVPANGLHDTTTSATVQRSVDLQSEVIDSTSMWRVYLRAIDSYVCCTVVFRCALQPDNALWIVGATCLVRRQNLDNRGADPPNALIKHGTCQQSSESPARAVTRRGLHASWWWIQQGLHQDRARLHR